MTAPYRGPQVCNITGITYRQLDYWCRTGLIVPSISGSSGPGTIRGFSHRDLIMVKIIKRLLDTAVSLQQIRRTVDPIYAYDGDWDGVCLMVSSAGAAVASTGQEVVDYLKGSTYPILTVIPLSNILDELGAHPLVGVA